jgi:hypothetical protein
MDITVIKDKLAYDLSMNEKIKGFIKYWIDATKSFNSGYISIGNILGME